MISGGRYGDIFQTLFIEDLLDWDDWDGFTKAVQTIGRSIILADDLIVTNPERLELAAKISAVDGFILKPNQVGTIAEALECFEYASQNAILTIPSGRSGGVIDDVVMDLAVGLAAPFHKNGAPRSGERIEKLNFLLRAAERIPNCALADVPALVRLRELSAARRPTAALPPRRQRTPPRRSKVPSSQPVSVATGPPRSDRCRRGR